jgi:hypothetical protein
VIGLGGLLDSARLVEGETYDLPEVSTKKISIRRGTFDDEVSALPILSLMPTGNFNFGCVTCDLVEFY